MRDYNFFSFYERKKGINIDPKSSYFIAIIMILVFSLLSIGLVVRNVILTSQLNERNGEIILLQESAEYKEAQAFRNALDKMAEYEQGADIVLADFESQNVLATSILDQLTAALPTTVTATTLEFNHAALTGIFTLPDKKTCAELLLRLEQTGLFSSVHAPNLFQSEGQAGFIVVVECEMKAGDIQ